MGGNLGREVSRVLRVWCIGEAYRAMLDCETVYCLLGVYGVECVLLGRVCLLSAVALELGNSGGVMLYVAATSRLGGPGLLLMLGHDAYVVSF